jgi:hypothetical protein
VFDKTNPHFKARYASLDAIHDAIREPLAANGLALSHLITIEANGGNPTQGYGHVMHTTLFHESGESMQCSFLVVAEKMTPQQFGSLLTYYRRYSICCLLALPTGVEDDDGEQAQSSYRKPTGNPPQAEAAAVPISPSQVMHLVELLDHDEALHNNLLAAYKVSFLTDLPAKSYESILRRINAKKEEVKE